MSQPTEAPPRTWLLVAFMSLSALCFGELYEQIVFVPNWLIGDVPANVAHFAAFKHSADPGMFFGPTAIASLVAHVVLIRRRDRYPDDTRQAITISFALLLVVIALTAYIIPGLNIPLFDERTVAPADLEPALQQWAALNTFRIALPAYALLRLSRILTPA